MKIGIDASNIKAGGGLTNLIELINNFDFSMLPGLKVIIWGGEQLKKIPDKVWLEKKMEPMLLKQTFLSESLWKLFVFKNRVKEVDLVYSPGGSLVVKSKPYVSMSQNMLVFEEKERQRYGKLSMTYLRLRILEFVQMRSFKNATKVIFISNYAKQYIISKHKATYLLNSPVIYSGVSNKFSSDVKEQLPLRSYNKENPIKLLYVSIIDAYKHHKEVIESIEMLLKDNYPIEMNFVGGRGSIKHYLEFVSKLNILDTKYKKSVKLIENVNYTEIHKFYAEADIFIFASSCENMPNILIEAMTAGLPILSSNRGPMPEFLEDSAIYFNPENPKEIYNSLVQYINNPNLRKANALKSKKLASKFSWKECSATILNLFAEINQ